MKNAHQFNSLPSAPPPETAQTCPLTANSSLTAEFKINLVAPAAGDRILARGRVVKAGRTLTLAQAEVFAESGRQEKLIALLTATLMAVPERDGISD